MGEVIVVYVDVVDRDDDVAGSDGEPYDEENETQ